MHRDQRGHIAAALHHVAGDTLLVTALGWFCDQDTNIAPPAPGAVAAGAGLLLGGAR